MAEGSFAVGVVCVLGSSVEPSVWRVGLGPCRRRGSAQGGEESGL